MRDAWEPHVQKTGQLTVFPGDGLRNSAAWGMTLFERVLREFNTIASENLLGVRLVAKLDQAPQKNGLGADVLFDATSGVCKVFNAAGQDETHHLPTGPNRIRGRCFRPISFSGPGAKFRFSWKAFIFVPDNPMVGKQTAAIPIRLAVALHEFIHACGLDEDEPGHGRENQPLPPGPLDLFATNSTVFEGTDKLFAGGTAIPDANGKFSITPRTASLIKDIWLLGRF